MLDDIYSVRVDGEGSGEAPAEVDRKNLDAGFTGDFDHFGIDRKGNRLFLAAEEHKTVEVFDLQTGARIHSIEGFAYPLMMVYLSDSNQY